MTDRHGARRWVRRRLLSLSRPGVGRSSRCNAPVTGWRSLRDWVRVATSEQPTSARVVVLVPGATGSMLRDAGGTVHWGRGLDLIRPHDGGYAWLVRSCHAAGRRLSKRSPSSTPSVSRASSASPSTVRCCAGSKRSATGAATSPIPRPDDTLLPFAWDWRESHVEGAAKLARSLESRAASARSRRPAGRAGVPELGRSSVPLLREVRRRVARGGRSRARPPAGAHRRDDPRSRRVVERRQPSHPARARPRPQIHPAGRTQCRSPRRCSPSLRSSRICRRIDATSSSSAEGERSRRRSLRRGVLGPLRLVGLRRQRAPAARSPRRSGRIRYRGGASRLPALDARSSAAVPASAARDVGWSRPPRYHLIQGRSEPKTPERAVLSCEKTSRRTSSGDSCSRATPRSTAIRGCSRSPPPPATSTPRSKASSGCRRRRPPASRSTVYVPGAHFEMILTPEAAAALAAALAD